MKDEPRHVALERQLEADGWERDEGDSYQGATLWHLRRTNATWVPQDPHGLGFDYESMCDEVLVVMARARGETWADALREVERLEVEWALEQADALLARISEGGSAHGDIDSRSILDAAIERHRARQDGGEA